MPTPNAARAIRTLLAAAQPGMEEQTREVLDRALAAVEEIERLPKRTGIFPSIAETLVEVAEPGDERAVQWVIAALRAARARGQEEVWQHIGAFAPLLGKLGVLPAVWERVERVESLRR